MAPQTYPRVFLNELIVCGYFCIPPRAGALTTEYGHASFVAEAVEGH